MTRLRKMMLEELQRRNYSADTTRNYLRVVADFARHFGKSPDKLGLNELRTYQAYLLRERKLTPGTVVNQVAALRFFFVKTLKRHQFRDFLPYPQDQRRLPTVLSREEVSRLINAAGNLFRRTLLMDDKGTFRGRDTCSRNSDAQLSAWRWYCLQLVYRLPVSPNSHSTTTSGRSILIPRNGLANLLHLRAIATRIDVK